MRTHRASDFTLEFVTDALRPTGMLREEDRRTAAARENLQRARLLRDASGRGGGALRRADLSPVELLASFGGESAVQNALVRSNIPTPDLDETARSAGGVRNASEMDRPVSGPPSSVWPTPGESGLLPPSDNSFISTPVGLRINMAAGIHIAPTAAPAMRNVDRHPREDIRYVTISGMTAVPRLTPSVATPTARPCLLVNHNATRETGIAKEALMLSPIRSPSNT